MHSNKPKEFNPKTVAELLWILFFKFVSYIFEVDPEAQV